ncbi:helix-turn-helix transcriptional regulator [Streptococcus suis]|nr:helix-turn-helix transcriptional regulator [Streptococcus suis]
MTTADKIKYILQKTGWTRDQFATEMGVTKLSVYERSLDWYYWSNPDT